MRNKTWLIRLALCALLVACLTAAGQPAKKSSADAATTKRLHAAVVETLRDAESARFRGEYLSLAEDGQDPAVRSLCGEVNAKNAYGGYVGFTRFIANSEGMMAFDPADPVWAVWCARPISK